MPRPRHNDIVIAIKALDTKKSSYLVTRGWTTSCAFPDSCWYWTKRIRLARKGRRVMTTIAVSLDVAVRLQSCLDSREGTTH